MTNQDVRTLTPEQQIDNVLHSLDKLVNGSAHRYRMDAIRSTVKQLSEMWQLYQEGKLEPITDNELPF